MIEKIPKSTTGKAVAAVGILALIGGLAWVVYEGYQLRGLLDFPDRYRRSGG